MKGKHAQAAAVRHEVQSRDAEIATYQRAVARLTAEGAALRADRDAERVRNRQAERELRARLDAAAAPKIDALELRVKSLTESLRERDAALAERAAMWDKAFHNLCAHFDVEHKLPPLQATEEAMRLVSPERWGNTILIGDDAQLEGLSPDRVITLQRARGQRR